MATILIIGSEGFIGRNLVAYFSGKGHVVSGIDRADNPSSAYDYYKLLELSDITEFLLRHRFRYIINAAGSGNVGFSIAHPLSDFESNCFETAKILDAIRIAGGEIGYIHISSAAVYGNPESMPVSEDSILRPLSPYGFHKLISEQLCREYLELYGIKCCIVRPFSVFGPGLRKQLFWDLYHKATGQDAIELFGTGEESRDFIYITDLVMAMDLLIREAPMEGECYNLASGVETTIGTIAGVFVGHFEHRPRLTFNGQVKPGDPLNWKADISKITGLGFKTTMPMEEGIERTFRWIKKVSAS